MADWQVCEQCLAYLIVSELKLILLHSPLTLCRLPRQCESAVLGVLCRAIKSIEQVAWHLANTLDRGCEACLLIM